MLPPILYAIISCAAMFFVGDLLARATPKISLLDLRPPGHVPYRFYEHIMSSESEYNKTRFAQAQFRYEHLKKADDIYEHDFYRGMPAICVPILLYLNLNVIELWSAIPSIILFVLTIASCAGSYLLTKKKANINYIEKSDGIMICFEEWSKDIQTCDEAIDYMEKVCNAYTDFLTARSTAVKDVIKRSHRSLSMMISIYVLITLWGLLFR